MNDVRANQKESSHPEQRLAAVQLSALHIGAFSLVFFPFIAIKNRLALSGFKWDSKGL